jgi:hypothetical protein
MGTRVVDAGQELVTYYTRFLLSEWGEVGEYGFSAG